jgi:mono/diheme cytochrome c family protein
MMLSMTRAVVGIAALSLSLTGCGGDKHPAYSANVKYGVRHDPIVVTAKELGEDRFDPDRPGVLPLVKFDDIFNSDHPYHAKLLTDASISAAAYLVAERKAPIDAKAADADKKKIEEERKKIQDEAIPKIKATPSAYRHELQHVLDKKGIFRFPDLLPVNDRKELEALLEKAFGTPAKPTINPVELGIDAKDLAELKLDDATLAKGSTRYRIHCLHCHGVPGDGRGPTARWINPHPRDFRAGVFKFQSVDRNKGADSPTRADLLRTLRQGIEGTAMPSFVILDDDDLESIVSYVIHLSLRGQVEVDTMKTSFELDSETKELKAAAPEEGLSAVAASVKRFGAKRFNGGWLLSSKPASLIKVEEYHLTPDQFAASVRRGQQIFTSKISAEFKKEYYDDRRPAALNAAKTTARAAKLAEAEDLLIAEAEDKAVKEAKAKKADLTDEEIAKIKESVDQDKIKKGVDQKSIFAMVEKDLPKIEKLAEKEIDDRFNKVAGVQCTSCHNDYGRQAKFKFDGWGTLVRPNNFTQGVFRGGKRPVDMYYRIHSGIPGSEMQAFGDTFKGQEKYIWDLVNFVTVASYPAMHKGIDLRLTP